MIKHIPPIRIDLPFLDYSKRQNAKCKECYVLLYRHHLEYKIIANYDELNQETEIFESKKSNYRFVGLRADLSRVGMYFDNKERLWSVDMEFKGVTDTNGWWFETNSEAIKVYDMLREYMTQHLYEKADPIAAPNPERSVATDDSSEPTQAG